MTFKVQNKGPQVYLFSYKTKPAQHRTATCTDNLDVVGRIALKLRYHRHV